MIAVLFDIDGTLLASGGAGKAALESAFVEIFGVALREQIPYSGRTDRAIARDLLSKHDIEHTLENWQRLLTAYLARLPECLHRHDGRILPGILRILSELRSRENVRVGLLTGNVRAGAKVKLGHFGIYDHFAFGGFGDHHFDRDDVAREALTATHDHVGHPLAPERIWVIGDTPLDVRCARAIGAKVVAVATGAYTTEQLAASSPDITMRDFSDASQFLDRLK